MTCQRTRGVGDVGVQLLCKEKRKAIGQTEGEKVRKRESTLQLSKRERERERERE